VNRRPLGRLLAACAALAAFGWAGWAAHDNAMPELRVFDGYRMILGAAVAVLLVAPLVWRWRRERSLLVISLAAAAGSLAPLVASAIQHNMPIMARLRGSWRLAGAGLVGPAVVMGFAFLWLAIRESKPVKPAGQENR
jgi:hypothetical protein